jgi:small subunit ribosomal protein S20
MPNTKSAERRMRNSARKHVHNRSIASRLHSLEKKYLQSLEAGNPEEAAQAFRVVVSAWDKAAKSGTVPKARANRKKSRFALRLAHPGKAAPASAAPASKAAPAA